MLICMYTWTLLGSKDFIISPKIVITKVKERKSNSRVGIRYCDSYGGFKISVSTISSVIKNE